MTDRINAQTSLLFKLKFLGMANNMVAKQDSLLPTPFTKHWQITSNKGKTSIVYCFPSSAPNGIFLQKKKKKVLILKELKELVFTSYLP